MKIHIIPHGKNTDHIKRGLRAFKAIDRIYLLPGDKYRRVSSSLKNDLENFGYEVGIREIDAFNLRSIVDEIVGIAKENENADFFINITGGTNLMAGGATSSAFFIGAQAYYVLEGNEKETSIDELVIELPVPTQPLYLEIEGLKRDILKVIKERTLNGKNYVTQKDIRDELGESPQNISYHVKDLEKKGLIEKTVDGRNTKIKLMPQGELYLQWTG